LSRARALAFAAVVLAMSAGCVVKNLDYCAEDAGPGYKAEYHHSCNTWDAALHDKPDVADATDANDAGDAADVAETNDAPADGDAAEVPGDADAMEAPLEKPMCSNATCGADGGAPICDVDAGVCRACSTAAECVARDRSLHGCESGACFACTKSAECTDVATAPICEGHQCRGCSAAAECVARDSKLHGCEGGQCFACTKNAECTDAATAPICDGHACRACHVDADCKGVGAEVCMEDGSCLLTADAIFADANAPTCPGNGTGAMPYCGAQVAVDQALLAGKKAVVLIGNGVFGPVALNAAGKSLAIIARDPVALEPGTDVMTSVPYVGLSLTDGDLLVRGLEIRKSKTMAVDAEGGVIRLHRCFIHDNVDSGLFVKKAGFHVENTVFANNGGSTKANVDLEATTSAVTVFRNNTIINGLAGVVCAQPFAITGCLAFGGGITFGTSCAATDACATMCSGHDPKLDPATFALTAASPAGCVDKLVPANGPALDRLGTARPVGTMSDCGADELNP
jgi:hypothetical protein